jgi:hypothetical protein
MQNHKKTKKRKRKHNNIYTNPTKLVALHGEKNRPILIAKSTFIIRKY